MGWGGGRGKVELEIRPFQSAQPPSCAQHGFGGSGSPGNSRTPTSRNGWSGRTMYV
jgi:hypothetical protein